MGMGEYGTHVNYLHRIQDIHDQAVLVATADVKFVTVDSPEPANGPR